MIHKRTAPSAGRSYPLRIYTIMSNGIYLYNGINHDLKPTTDEDRRTKLTHAALNRINSQALKVAPVTFVVTALHQEALQATPLMEEANRYIHLEAGHATQNLCLQATVLDLGVVTITSFKNSIVFKALNLARDRRPIYLLPVGYPSNT